MSKQTAELLEAIEALPEDEKRFLQSYFCGVRCLSIPARWMMTRPPLPRMNYSPAWTRKSMIPVRGEVFDFGMAVGGIETWHRSPTEVILHNVLASPSFRSLSRVCFIPASGFPTPC